MYTKRVVGTSALFLAFGFGCSTKIESPPPALSGISPVAVCVEQLTTTVSLAGDQLTPVPSDVLLDSPKLILPALDLRRIKDLTGAAAQGPNVRIPDDPANAAASQVAWQSTKMMTFRVSPERMLQPGLYSIQVTNADGSTITMPDALLGVPRPTLTRIDPDLLCSDKANTLMLTGEGFIQGPGGATPRVRIGSFDFTPESMEGCRALPGTGGFSTCTRAVVRLATKALAPGRHAVTLTNPAPVDCVSTDSVELTLVPEPTLAQVFPDLECTEQDETRYTLAGTGFLRVGDRIPTVSFGSVVVPGTPSDCTPVPGPRETVESCRTLTTTLAAGALTPGAHPVVVTNPGPADCMTKQDVRLYIEPPPALDRIAPDVICTDQMTSSLVLTGSGFLEVTDPGSPARVPLVRFSPEGGGATSTISGARTSSCTDVPGPREMVRRCSRLEVDLPPMTLSTGVHEVTVLNPSPPDCRSTDVRRLVAVTPPSISGLSVPAVCLGSNQRDVTIEGAGFLVVGSMSPPVAVPTVTLVQGMTTFVLSAPNPTDPLSVRPGMCQPLQGTTEPIQICSRLTFTVPAGAAVGDYDLTVTNPIASCSSVESVQVAVTLPPTIDPVNGVQPLSICSTGGTLTVRGADFSPAAVVTVGGVPSQSVQVDPAGTTIVGTFGDLSTLTIDQLYPVTVRNSLGCEATAASEVRITQGVFTYFVDPPVVYNGINTRITLLTTGISGRPITVTLRHAPSNTTLTFADAEVIWDQARPSRVQVTLPRTAAGMAVPAGAWEAQVLDGRGCGNMLADAFVVTDRLELGLVSITPTFGQRGADTAVVMRARATATATPPLSLFRRTPVAYLSPSSNPAAEATELRSVSFVDDAVAPAEESNTVTALVPGRTVTLAVGDYDVLVVNPDGKVGLLAAAYRVTADPPPVIETIVPGSITSAPGQNVRIQGSGFRIDPSCLNAAGRESTCVSLSCGRIGAMTAATTPPTVVTAATGGTVDIRIDASALAAGDACAVRLTNADGTFTDFSAITVSNPSSGNNPIAFIQVPPMLTGRRAPAAVGARATPAARFVYAIGGDRGTDDQALATVEAAPVGLFGELGSWFRIPVDLPEARTRAGVVRIGRFLYLIGGHVPGSGATASVLRSTILDPAESPRMGDPDLRLLRNQAGGLPAGVWYYRIAAVMAATDGSNPGGETLPSEPLVVRVPASPGNRAQLRVSWLAHPGAASYRLYRSTAPDQSGGAERLLCVLPPARLDYEDDGDQTNDVNPACTPDPQVSPLPLGSTGAWSPLMPDAGGVQVARAMVEARASAGVAVAADRTDTALRHIYVVGGHSGASIRDSYERLTVRLASPSSQQVLGPWTAGTQRLTARTELGVLVADQSTAPRVGANVCVVALAGRTGPNATTGRVEVAALPSSGGELSAWDSTFSGPGQANVSGSPAGFGAAFANDTIYVIGGASNGTTPTDGGTSRMLASPAPSCDAFETPWQSLGQIALRSRYLGGTAIQSGFIYVIGGSTGVTGGTCGDGTPAAAAASCFVDGSVLGGQP